ncbi:MAG: hypothetical protein ACRDQA_22805 [Nocardioidaceae bacterium]
MDSGHKKYDRPEPKQETGSKAVMFIIGGIVVFALLYLIASGQVPFAG